MVRMARVSQVCAFSISGHEKLPQRCGVYFVLKKPSMLRVREQDHCGVESERYRACASQKRSGVAEFQLIVSCTVSTIDLALFRLVDPAMLSSV